MAAWLGDFARLHFCSLLQKKDLSNGWSSEMLSGSIASWSRKAISCMKLLRFSVSSLELQAQTTCMPFKGDVVP